MSGWIKLHRKIKENWIWSNSDYFKWWMDIILEANHEPVKVLIKGTLLECGIGEKLYSYETWAKRWNVNKSKAMRFLKLLESDNMITLKNEMVTTRLTICNYDSYQEVKQLNETEVKRKRNGSETEVKPIKELKELIRSSSIKTPTLQNEDRVIIKHNEFKTECLKSIAWMEATSSQTKLELQHFDKALKDFNKHLISIGENKMNLGQYKSHFTSWVRKLKNKN